LEKFLFAGVAHPPSALHAQVRTPVPPGLFMVLREPKAHERLKRSVAQKVL
jgi:hypothetical protein